MKFNCGPSWEERKAAKIAYKEEWHPWFAWFPVRVGDRDCRWLETVERKGRFFCGYEGTYWIYEYRGK